MIETDPAKVCFIIVKAREVHAKVEVENPVEPENPETASDAADDGFRVILEDYASDATYQELKDFLDGLNRDERIDVLALMWLGRGDFLIDEWNEACAAAADAADETETTYLIGTPLIADYLEEGLSQHGYSCTEYEIGRL
jgi:hypothetical protein